MNKFYVYKIIRPWNNTVAYIGKGSGNRYDHHRSYYERNCHYNKHISYIFKKSRELGLEPIIEFVALDLLEEDSFKIEKELIKYYGRKDLKTGTLANLTDGGEGSSNPSKETLQKMIEKRKNISIETREKMRNSHSGQKNHRFGIHLLEETKRKISNTLKGKMTKEKNPFFGQKHSEETRKKMSENHKSKKAR